MITSFFLYDEFAPGNLRYKEIGNFVSSYELASVQGYVFVKRNKQVLAVPKLHTSINGWLVRPYSELASMNIRTTIDDARKVGELCRRLTIYYKDTQAYLYIWKYMFDPSDHIIGPNNFLHFQDQA